MLQFIQACQGLDQSDAVLISDLAQEMEERNIHFKDFDKAEGENPIDSPAFQNFLEIISQRECFTVNLQKETISFNE